MLSQRDLDGIRSSIRDSLPDTAQVLRRSLLSDEAGGFVESFHIVATAPCRVSPAGWEPEERVIADKLTGVNAWILTLPALTDVRPVDRIVVNSRTFEVIAALSRSQEVSCRVVCAEVV